MEKSYSEQIREALSVGFKGWDFSYILESGRMKEEGFDWSYEKIVRSYFTRTTTMLDMGTGGGEVLSSLMPLPQKTYATESYVPNVEVARNKISFIRFYDIGAFVYYLKAIPWLVEDFTPEKYDKQLKYIHQIIQNQGYYQTLAHRFFIIAKKS